MRILLLTRYSRLGASSRIRFLQYVTALRALGIEVEVSPLLCDNYIRRLYVRKPLSLLEMGKDYFRRFSRLITARRYNLVWLEKELFPNMPAWFEQVLAGMGVRYVVDYDDAIFHNYDLSSNPLKRSLAHKIDTVMGCSSLVVCGNEYLADRARAAGAPNIRIIPTVIDLDLYTVAAAPVREGIIVGWIGSPSTVKYLESLVPALTQLSKEYPVRLRVIGADFSSPGLVVECIEWSEESEVREIQEFDIGVMPLLDSPWEQGKCGYKLIQYMACGLPVVASPVGVNREIVKQGVNGYLAAAPTDWTAALRTLCADSERRRTMGTNGRQLVEQKYSLQVTVPLMAQLFHDVLAQRIT